MRYAHSFLTLSVPLSIERDFGVLGNKVQRKPRNRERKEHVCIVQPVDANIVVESKSSM